MLNRQDRLNVIAYTASSSPCRRQKQLLMAPGQRADVAYRRRVPTNSPPCRSISHARPQAAGAWSSPRPAADEAPAALPAAARDDLTARSLAGARWCSATSPERCRWPLAGIHLADGKIFDLAHRPAGAAGRGEEWTIRNNRAIEVGQPQTDRTWRIPWSPGRPKAAAPSSARASRHTGIFMLHCRTMNHEEMGMMQTVEVYRSDHPKGGKRIAAEVALRFHRRHYSITSSRLRAVSPHVSRLTNDLNPVGTPVCAFLSTGGARSRGRYSTSHGQTFFENTTRPACSIVLRDGQRRVRLRLTSSID